MAAALVSLEPAALGFTEGRGASSDPPEGSPPARTIPAIDISPEA
jgi:hypothetical protein